MVKNKFFWVVQFCFFALLFQGCSDTTDTLSVVHVSGVISSNTNWTNNHIYVVDEDVIVENATLTIQAGTVVKISQDQGITAREASGIINAMGTAASPIIFTSTADDYFGGDTDDLNITPAEGDWDTIFVNATGPGAESTFIYCEFYYGGHGTYEDNAMLEIYDAPAIIDNCIFAHSENSALNVVNADIETEVTNNVFYDNIKPLWMSPDFSIDGTNMFHNPVLPQIKNYYNAIWLWSSIYISADRYWGDNGVPYVSEDGFTIMDDVLLTVEPGTVVKFYDETVTVSADVVLESGADIANLEYAYFTSYYDDAHGGDTNEDGAIPVPVGGYWKGIFSNDLGAYFDDPGIWYALNP